ncbi:unnamed protein product [Spirodela intermedia]|uniref:Uncharacterized protein n=1 Tax=Spirodela intermedia TaxID=51605 RepID=A0ABN7E9M7_SPIIN|nr:unnamed protein product [Spirodela intermedia]
MNFDSRRIRTCAAKSFSRVYDHSLPHSRWPPVTWKGSGNARALFGPQAKPLEPLLARGLLPDCASNPLAAPAGRRAKLSMTKGLNTLHHRNMPTNKSSLS